VILCCGTLASTCLQAAESLQHDGLKIGVVNARFVKPIDREMIARAVRECAFVVTVEEGALMGGFGSAVLEAACDAGLETCRIHRLGIGDEFVEHGDRQELLAHLGLNAAEIARVCRELASPDVPSGEFQSETIGGETRPT
jgi:1-deoxy-D-xylulose-5-phosphate synthase